MKVHKLGFSEIEQIREARAEWGHGKYGDRDEFRDSSIDMLEETLDIKNILNRRIMWIEKNKNMTLEIDIAKTNILINYNRMIEAIQEFSLAIDKSNYIVDDSNGGTRIGINDNNS